MTVFPGHRDLNSDATLHTARENRRYKAARIIMPETELSPFQNFRIFALYKGCNCAYFLKGETEKALHGVTTHTGPGSERQFAAEFLVLQRCP